VRALLRSSWRRSQRRRRPPPPLMLFPGQRSRMDVATERRLPESYAAKVGTFPCFAIVAAVAVAFRNHHHRRHRYLLPRRRAIRCANQEKTSVFARIFRKPLRSILFDVPGQSRASRTHPSITLLSRVVDFFRECSVAVGTMSGRSQQPRPDRFQDLLQRQTRSFFLPQGRWSG
jgi:hypothetical protein